MGDSLSLYQLTRRAAALQIQGFIFSIFLHMSILRRCGEFNSAGQNGELKREKTIEKTLKRTCAKFTENILPVTPEGDLSRGGHLQVKTPSVPLLPPLPIRCLAQLGRAIDGDQSVVDRSQKCAFSFCASGRLQATGDPRPSSNTLHCALFPQGSIQKAWRAGNRVASGGTAGEIQSHEVSFRPGPLPHFFMIFLARRPPATFL